MAIHGGDRGNEILMDGLAEGAGFEPASLAASGFQDRRFQPLTHPSTWKDNKRLPLLTPVLERRYAPAKFTGRRAFDVRPRATAGQSGTNSAE